MKDNKKWIKISSIKDYNNQCKVHRTLKHGYVYNCLNVRRDFALWFKTKKN